ncbi:MAG: hypothetical protein A2486_10275 [Burkholderiales bacterium RIFOXYC12_FULL_65_23]|nr:MAG: hypothetical protein A2486_10275 [Burkholderiales bacterium RIFOXYC12_FULL_65_23]
MQAGQPALSGRLLDRACGCSVAGGAFLLRAGLDPCVAGAGAAGAGGRDAAGAADFAGATMVAGALVGRLFGLACSSGGSVLSTMPAWQVAARPMAKTGASPVLSQCLLADLAGKVVMPVLPAQSLSRGDCSADCSQLPVP